MNDEYIRKLFSADHAETLAFSYATDNEYCLDFLEEQLGGHLVVTNSRLAEVMGIEATDYSEAKKILLESYDKGNHIFGINAGEHSGYWFHIVDGLSNPDPWDGMKGLNFIVIDKEKFLKNSPKDTYCRKNVFRWVKRIEDYFQNSINGCLTEVFYQGPEDAYVFGTFTDLNEAVEEARFEFPHIRYLESDFEIIGYRLKQSAA